MRTRNAAASRTDHQGQLTLLMVVVPSLLVAMTRVTDPVSRLLLGLAVGLALVAGATYAYHLGKPVYRATSGRACHPPTGRTAARRFALRLPSATHAATRRPYAAFESGELPAR